MNEFYGSIHNHTDRSNFRLRDSTNRLEELCWYAAKDLGHNFIAITDHETIATAIDCQKVEKKIRQEFPDFKIIRGNEIYLCRNGLNKENYVRSEDKFFHWILLAKDEIGHRQIREISTRAWSHCFMQGKMLRVPTYYQDLIDIIGEDKGHVIMSTACFKKDTPVLTKTGYKPIQTITNQDFILNKRGEWEKVNYPTSRNYRGIGYQIDFLEQKQPIVCTENHKFLTIESNRKPKMQWVEAKDLNKTTKTKHICLFPIINQYDQNKEILRRNEWDSFKSRNKKSIILKDAILITPELMRFFGLFLGDGSISVIPEKNYYCINYTFNEKEFDCYWNSFIKKASEDLGIHWSINRRPENHRIDISCHSIELTNLFYFLFGNSKANTKRIPERLKNISKELDYELIFGYMLADGYFRKRNNKNMSSLKTGEMVSASISQELTYGIQNMLKNMGIRGSIYEEKERVDKKGVSHQKAWYFSSSNNAWAIVNKTTEYSHKDVVEIFKKAKEHCKSRFIEIDNILYKKVYIKNIKKLELNEEVYCLNVDSHSFVCNDVIVHNCLGSYPSQMLLKYNETKDEELWQYILAWFNRIIEICGKENLYLETQPSYNKEQIVVNLLYKKLSEELDIPVVISLDAHYLKQEDEPIHHAFLTSQEGDRETHDFYASTYMMSREEIHEYMDNSLSKETVTEWMNNTQRIYNECKDYDLTKPTRIPYLPKTIDTITETEFLAFKNKIKELSYFYNSEHNENRDLAAAIVRKILVDPTQYNNQETFEMIDDNLKAIRLASEKMNTQWSAYLLNLRDYVNVIWNQGNSLMGPARGSGTGFLLLNMLGVTQINPLRETTKTYSFRFLNPERVSPLDVDLDIEGGKRAQVYKALQDAYGEDRVSKVLTIRTEKSKSAILTAARGLGLDPDEGAYLASFIKSDRGQQRSLKQTYYGDIENDMLPDKKFQELMDGKYSELWEVAQYIEGLCCGVGRHNCSL